MTPETAFADRLRTDPGSPLVTFYDDESGERAELSAKSVANWVAKTHHLLGDELGLGPGDRAWLTLPVHWLAVPVLFGCWFAGLEVVTDASAASGASVAFGDAEALVAAEADGALSGVDERFAVSLLSMARSAEPPPGMNDYAASVRPHADAWAGVRPQGAANEDALDGLTRVTLAHRAVERAGELGLEPGGRLLYAGAGRWDAPALIDALIAPLMVNGSVVLIRHADPDRIAGKISSEKVTVTR